MKKVVLITALVLAVYLILGWYTGIWMDLGGARLWIFRAAFALIGIGAAAFVLWFFRNKEKRENAENQALDPTGLDDLDSLIRDARVKLRKSNLRPGTLPVVFVLGESDSAKTTTIVHSGVHPEPLAGQQVDGAGDVVATPTANFWYGQGAVFVEASGRLLDDPKSWRRIAEALQPRGFGAAVSGRSTAPSAALVTFDVGNLVQPGAETALKVSARRLRDRLIDISQALGVQIPVYVLFTKTDKVPFFAEFSRNLIGDEPAQVLGATVPMKSTAEGVYADEETARLTGEFEALYRSLCDWRPAVLSREQDSHNLPGSYQFPRELRKLRPNLVQFLVDLCRPSHLTTGPVLRGFYFSGVRPIDVTESADGPAPAPRQSTALAGGTVFFRAGAGQPASRPTAGATTRRVPQWIFLSQLFHQALLSDQGARGATGISTRTSRLQRVLLVSACVLCLLYCIALVVSYGRNRRLEAPWRAAAGIEAAGPNGATIDSLRHLEALRESLSSITWYQREGSPLSLRWGLNIVGDLYPQARQIYFAEFRKLLLAPTQAAMVQSMRRLPLTAGNPEYAPTYDSLKAYLITTSNPEKATRALSPVLTLWSGSRNGDAERLALTRRQFDFYSDELKSYSEELKAQNRFSPENDAVAVKNARRYLSLFAGIERVYAAMLADAGKNMEPVNFNKQFPGSADTVVDSYEVGGAFTKSGWDVMRKSLRTPERYFSGESWVLGEQGPANVDLSQLGSQLETRYNSDFVKQWGNYLKSARVVTCTSKADASKKLAVIAGNQSTLLAMFSLASRNTAVEVPEVSTVFQPVQAVVPSASPILIAPPNQAYMTALLQLQAALEAEVGAPGNAQTAEQTDTKARDALLAARQTAQTFRADPNGHIDSVVAKLLEDPISCAKPQEDLNAKGRDLCAKLEPVLQKYPFSSKVTAPQATIEDVNAFFRPGDGALWTLYDSSGLKKLLVKQGGRYEAAPDAAVPLNPAFVRFFSEAASLSLGWYADGARDPHFAYALRRLPSENTQAVTLRLDSQEFSYPNSNSPSKQFVWQAAYPHDAKEDPHGATISGGSDLGWKNKTGLWAVFQLFADAENRRTAGDIETLEWIPRVGNDVMTVAGKPGTVRFELNMMGAPPVFRERYFQGLGCIAKITK